MVGTSSTPVDLVMTAGLPYNRRVRVLNAKNVWGESSLFEVRSQIRASRLSTSELLYDLGFHLVSTYDGIDILIELSLTGDQTRKLPKKGFYDMVISDVGKEDARAVPVLFGKVKVGSLITSANDD